MSEEKITAVANVLARWNPMGEGARNVADLDGYRLEAADIIFELRARGNSGKPERLAMEVINWLQSRRHSRSLPNCGCGW